MRNEKQNEKTNINAYREDEFYKKWLVGLSARTKENYGNEIRDWIVFTNMTPTEQIQKRMHDLTTTDITERTFFEEQFRKYKTYLEQRGDLKPSAVKTMLIPVASFFSRNSMPLNLKRGDWESTMQQEVTTRFKLARDDVRAMYIHANLRDKSLLLVLAQSGLSEVDVSCLCIEKFPKLYTIAENEHLFFEKPREKTGEMQATCLSAEALHDIKAMLSERDNPKSGWMFVGQTKSKNEQLEVRTINEAMKALAERTFGKEKAKEFKTKALRSFYNSCLLRASVQPQEIKDVMMGHARLSARKKYDYDDETIIENYKKAFEYLSINGIQVRSDIAKLKAEFDATKEQLLKIISDQHGELGVVKDKLAFLDKFIGLSDVVDSEAKAKRVLDFFEQLRSEKIAEDRAEEDKAKAEVAEKLKREGMNA